MDFLKLHHLHFLSQRLYVLSVSYCTKFVYVFFCIYLYIYKIKVSVQRKLRWVKNSTKRWALAWDCGTGNYFVVLFYLHLGLDIFPFQVSTPQFIGEFWKNRWNITSGQIRSINEDILQIFFFIPRFTHKWSKKLQHQ